MIHSSIVFLFGIHSYCNSDLVASPFCIGANTIQVFEASHGIGIVFFNKFLSSSIAKKVKERLSSSNRRPTLSCNAGYIDHELSNPCGFDFGLVHDFGFLCKFSFGGDMLNNFGLAYMQAHDRRDRGGG